MNNPMMTVDEAVEGFKRNLDKFAVKWKTNNAKSPDEWPGELPEGEWFDQIQAHLSMERETD